MNFWDSNVWQFILVASILLSSMMLAHALKKNIPFLNRSLIPASVLGGLIILLFTTIYKAITKESFFNLAIFSVVDENDAKVISGSNLLEIVTYHCLAIGFIAMGFRNTKKANSKKRTGEIFDTGITTVSTYLIQALVGLTLTILLAPKIQGLIEASGIILALGYGQGTGQALNYGRIYENNYHFMGGANFGLAVAALGFLSASIGGVIYLNILRRKGKLRKLNQQEIEELTIGSIQGKDEIPVNNSIDKFTIQLALVVGVYALSYLIMKGLGSIVGEGLRATIYGFNFLIGTLVAVVIKFLFKFLRKHNIMKKEYINNFMMNRIGGVAFDIMIVAGIAAIDLELIKDYWLLLMIMGILGALVTFFYIHFVSKVLFKEYRYEQFFAMYGMLTGTASTGIILLREIDPNFDTPASDNLVYQNVPAIIFGLPIMFLASYAPQSRQSAMICGCIVLGLLIVLLLILFRRQIFKKRKK